MSAIVYRAYDAQGQLLYVGKSIGLLTRLRDHRSTDKWWKAISRLELEHFDSPEDAFVREAQLIHELKPPYNKMIGHGWNARDERVLELRRAGKTWVEIMDELGISDHAIRRITQRLAETGRIARTPGSIRYHIVDSEEPA
jgi:DNA-directed RNA polymerase subunit N (RpoN/RPB10)